MESFPVATTTAQLAALRSQDASIARGDAVTPQQLALNLSIRGTLDLGILRDSLRLLVARHGALRASFNGDGHTVAARAEVQLPVMDLSTAGVNYREVMRSQTRRLAVDPIDRRCAPMFRSLLFQRSPREHHLFVVVSRLIADQRSLRIIHHDLQHCYDHLAVGIPLAPVGAYEQAQERMVHGQLAQASDGCATSCADEPTRDDFPFALPTKSRAAHATSVVTTLLGDAASAALMRQARRTQKSLTNLVTAAAVVLTSELTRRHRVAIWLECTHRGRHTLPDAVAWMSRKHLISATVGNNPFAEIIEEVQSAVACAQTHRWGNHSTTTARADAFSVGVETHNITPAVRHPRNAAGVTFERIATGSSRMFGGMNLAIFLTLPRIYISASYWNHIFARVAVTQLLTKYESTLMDLASS